MGVVEVNQQLATRWADHYENRPEYCIEKVDWKSEVPREEGKIRIVCISDTHSGVEKGEISFNIPNGDILIHAGDFTNYGEVDKVKEFNTWLGTLPHTHKIVIAGNRDFSFDTSMVGPDWKHWDKIQHPDVKHVKSMLTNCIYLEDTSVTIEGIKFYGTPWTNSRSNIREEGFKIPISDVEKWEEVCSSIPSDTDILISHCPPLGIRDVNSHGQMCGSELLLKHVVERIKPRYHIFGHIHEAYGVVTNGTTTFANASTCINKPSGKVSPKLVKVPENPPIVFDLQRTE